jgi:hypothetical protein
MALARTLLLYTFAIGALCAALIGGGMWLITPGPAVSREARVAPIPPRLADSIERKKPLPVRAPDPEPAKPAMTEAAVSLTPAPVRSYKIRELTPPVKRKRAPRGEQGVAQGTAPAAAAPAVTTARTDFPF